jgi:isopenicillin N synthase-like dioxygenase
MKLLQASDHPGLQVQNLSGEWIDVPPLPNSFVINIGKALDSATGGLARATSHRVLSPTKGSTPRYSVPFFQNISPHAHLNKVHLDFPPEILALKANRGKAGESDCVFLQIFFDECPDADVHWKRSTSPSSRRARHLHMSI